MKKRGSDDFPFNDLAGPQKPVRNESGEQADLKKDYTSDLKASFHNSSGNIHAEPAPEKPSPDYQVRQSVQRSSQSTSAQNPQRQPHSSYQQNAQPASNQGYQYTQNPAYQYSENPAYQMNPSGQQNSPRQQNPNYQQNANYQQRPQQNLSQQQSVSHQQNPVRYDGSSKYGREPIDQSRMNTSAPPYEYENRAPRPRTLNRQIQILSVIAVLLLIIVLVLGYFTFFSGKKSSGAAAATTAATTLSTVLQGGSVTVVPGASDNTLTPTAPPVSVTPVVTVDSDPNSLTNLPPSKEHPVIALTFDDGPSNTLTPKLLSVLEEKGVHVTFFMLGQMVLDADPAILKRMVADGDELGNHSYDHSIYTGLTEDEIRAELTKTNDAIFGAAGVYPTIMRPPTGGCNDTVLALSKELNMPVVNWSYESCPEDWLKAHQDPAFISKYVIDNAANGHIVLLHDIHSTTVDSIAAMIDGLKAKGYRFATVSELLAAQPDGKKTGVLYCYGTFT